MNVLGLDVGGANLKLASATGKAVSVPFPLWQSPERLGGCLSELAANFSPADAVAVTMTGELADCFATKAEGVDRILAAVEEAFPVDCAFVWTTDDRFVRPAEARLLVSRVAAANWHAQATWAGRLVPEGPAVLIDVGSTTTDLIPLQDGVPCPRGTTDPERLIARELIYRGVRRTPLMALIAEVPWRGTFIPVAAEVFATTLDVFLILGEIPEDPDDLNTANGRPATKAAAHDRLARMACCDRTEFTWDDAERAAIAIREAIVTPAVLALRILDPQPETLITSGSGAFLAREIGLRANPSAKCVSLSEALSPDLAEAACAYAAAVLLQEHLASHVPDRT